MPVFRMPQARKYDLSFRIFATSGILAGAILLFSFFGPEGISHSINVALAMIMVVIVLGTVVCAYVLPYVDSMSRLKRAFEWELTTDKLVQRFKDGKTVEIALNDLKSLREGRGWLVMNGSEPSKGFAIPSEVEGFEQLRRELMAHCTEAPSRVKWFPLAWIVEGFFALTFLLSVVSHNRAVFLTCGAIVLFVWPVWVRYSFRRIWRGARVPKRVLLAPILVWLLMCAWIFGIYAGRIYAGRKF